MALIKSLQSGPHQLFITTTQPERVEMLRPYGAGVLLLRPETRNELFALIEACDGMVILVAPKDAQTYEQTYLETAKTVTEALRDRVKPFYLVYTSSTSVCEGARSEWVTEDMLLNPSTNNSKILLETENCYLNSGAATCILRLGGIYGPAAI